MPENIKERSYKAFISYRHKDLDRETAVALQKKIEHFKVPKEFREANGGDRLGYCFRDEDELPTSSSLSDSIRYALDHTEFLIVICTPDLPKSEWCAEEIRYFLSTHDRDHLLAVLAWGEPEESFSPYMINEYDDEGNVLRNVEPLAANITGTKEHFSKSKFKKESVRIIAALLGVPFDELWQRERRYQTRRKAVIAGIAFAAMAVFAITVGMKNLEITQQNKQITEQNRQITEQNTQITQQNEAITAQNDQITAQNEEIIEKNQELQVREGRLLEEAGELMLEGHDLSGAAENARAALSIEGVHTEGAELLLTNALGAYDFEEMRVDTVVSQDTPIDRCCMLEDSSVIFTSDTYGVVRAFKDEEELWSFSAVPSLNIREYMDRECVTDIYLCENEEVLLAVNAYYAAGISPDDGSVIWKINKKDSVNFHSLSEDHSMLALLMDDPEDSVAVYSTKDGSVIYSSLLPQFTFDYSGIELHFYYTFIDGALVKSYGGNFSDDGRYFMFGVELNLTIADLLNMDVDDWLTDYTENVIYDDNLEQMQGLETSETEVSEENVDASRKTAMIYGLVDLEEKSIRPVGREMIQTGMNNVYGMNYDPESGMFFFTRSDDLDREIYAGTIDEAGNVSYTMQISNLKAYTSYAPWKYLEGSSMTALACADSLYIFRKPDGAFLGRYDLDRNIVSLEWVDRENDILMAVQEDGVYHVYPMSVTFNDIFTEAGETVGINDLNGAFASDRCIFDWNREANVLENSDESILLLSEGNPGKVYKAGFHTDPNAMEINEGNTFSKISSVRLSPDCSELWILEKQDSDMYLHRIDPKSGSLKDSTVFKGVNYSLGSPLGIYPDGSRLIYANCIFSSDGTAEYLEYTDASEFKPYDNNYTMEQCADGSIYSAIIRILNNDKQQIFVWKDEKALATFSVNNGTYFVTDEKAAEAAPGENALIKISGHGQVVAGLSKLKNTDYDGYMIISPDGSAKAVDSAGHSNPASVFAFRNTDNGFAVLEEDGVIRVYDPEHEEPVMEIESPDSFAGAVAMCYDDNDRYLGVLGYSGELRLYDAQNAEIIMQDVDTTLATGYGNTALELTVSKDGKRLFCIMTETEYKDISNGVVYELETFEKVTDISDVSLYDPESNNVVLFNVVSRTRRFFLCPLYDTQTLMSPEEH